MSTLSDRATSRAMAWAMAIPVTAVPPAGVHPDQELLAACAALDAGERRYLGSFWGPDAIADDGERDAANEANDRERERLVELVCRLRATTLDGYLARIRVIMLEDLDFDPAEDAQSGYFNVSLLGALLRDLAEAAGAARRAGA